MIIYPITCYKFYYAGVGTHTNITFLFNYEQMGIKNIKLVIICK